MNREALTYRPGTSHLPEEHWNAVAPVLRKLRKSLEGMGNQWQCSIHEDSRWPGFRIEKMDSQRIIDAVYLGLSAASIDKKDYQFELWQIRFRRRLFRAHLPEECVLVRSFSSTEIEEMTSVMRAIRELLIGAA